MTGRSSVVVTRALWALLLGALLVGCGGQEATGTPQATPTAAPTLTSTPAPTATDTPEPTATNTPEPTATNTPEPTPTEMAGLPMVDEPYLDEKGRFTIRHPEGWACGLGDFVSSSGCAQEGDWEEMPPVQVVMMPSSECEGQEGALTGIADTDAAVEARHVLVDDRSIEVMSWLGQDGANSGHFALVDNGEQCVVVMAVFDNQPDFAQIWSDFAPTFDAMVSSITFPGAVERADYRSADLSESDLSGADLVNADLREADLSVANLSGADLSGALLDLANLTGADLSDAVLTDAVARDADLTEVDLRRAKLMGADLTGATLNAADMRAAFVREADLTGADLTDADLRTAILAGADLTQAVLEGANLRKANLSWANLYEANLRGCPLNQALMQSTFLSMADLSEADLTGADLTGAVLSDSVLRGADLTWINLTDADLAGADLSAADLTGATVTDVQLAQAGSLEGATMPDGTEYVAGSLLAGDAQTVQVLPVTSELVPIEVVIEALPSDAWSTLKAEQDVTGPGIAYPMSAVADSAGTIWFGGVDAVVALGPQGEWQSYPEFATGGADLVSFALAPDGALLGAGCAGVYQLTAEGWQQIVGGPGSGGPNAMPWCATRILVTYDGAIWLNQLDIPQNHGHGALLISDDVLAWYGDADDAEFYTDQVVFAPWENGLLSSIIPGEDGAVWFATVEGVYGYKDDLWSTLPDEIYGYANWMTTAIAGPDGDLWFGTPIGFARFDGATWTSFQLSGDMQIDLFAFGFDSQGVLWLSALEGIGRFDGETLLFYEYVDGGPFSLVSRPALYGMTLAGLCDHMVFGPDGTLWMPAGPAGIVRIDLPEP